MPHNNNTKSQVHESWLLVFSVQNSEGLDTLQDSYIKLLTGFFSP